MASARPDPFERPRRALQGWRAVALGLALVATTLALRIALGFRVGDAPIGVMFVLPVMIAARYGGRAGGFAGTVAAALGTKLLLFAPTGSLAFGSATVFLHWALLVLVNAIATLLVDDVRRAHARAVEERNVALARQARYLRFFENISEAVVISALERDAAGAVVGARLIEANSKAVAGFPVTRDQLRGRPWSEVFPHDCEALLEKVRQMLVSPDRHLDFDAVLGGRHFRASLFGLDGDEFVGTGVEITAQRRLEEQFQQAQRLESVGRLAGGVAHDFNNIVTVVLSSAEALREDHEAGRPLDPDLVEEIRGAGERARDLTRQLLAFARRQIVNPVPLDLAEVVQRSEKLLRRVLGEDVALAVRARAGEGGTVRADPVQVEQVLFNLAVNAHDAMPGGGTLHIEVSAREDGADGPDHPAGRWVVLAVRDDGTGMTPEVQAHAFEPFFTTKEPGKGTGLGLATVHGVVLQSGGHLHLDSAPGRGTEIRICLPRIGERPARAPEPRPPERAGAGTLLVVEDDAQVRQVTVRALERGGYRVLVAASGREAQEAFRERPGRVDLLLTDVMMPGMGGHELALALQRERPGLPVLYISGYAPDFLVERRALGEGLPLLQKPFTSEALLARVRELLAGPGA